MPIGDVQQTEERGNITQQMKAPQTQAEFQMLQELGGDVSVIASALLMVSRGLPCMPEHLLSKSFQEKAEHTFK